MRNIEGSTQALQRSDGNLSFGFGFGSVCKVLGHTQSEEQLLSKTRRQERIPATVILPPTFAMSMSRSTFCMYPVKTQIFYKVTAKSWSRGCSSQLH